MNLLPCAKRVLLAFKQITIQSLSSSSPRPRKTSGVFSWPLAGPALAALGFLLCAGAAQADVLAGWAQTNAATAPSDYLAQTNHPKLTTAAIMNWKPRLGTDEYDEQFNIEPWCWTNVATIIGGVTNVCTNIFNMLDGVSATNQFSYANGSGASATLRAITNYVEFTFNVSNGYKISFTGMVHRMLVDERRLKFDLRSDVDGYTYRMFEKTTRFEAGVGTLITTNLQPSTNNAGAGGGGFGTYTNVISTRLHDITNSTVKLRLYGTEGLSKWVYAYWTNMGPAVGTAAYGSSMIVFAGKVTPVVDISPRRGPYVGGNTVLITNVITGAIGDGGDITNLTVDGASAPAILGQGTNWVRWTMPPASSAGAKDILIQSASAGATLFGAEYTYNPTGSIASVSPASGDLAGGYAVTIAGANLCDGTDATNVTICGVAATSIDSQSVTQIVVTAGAGVSGLGAVRIWSTSYGESVAAAAFTYNEQSTITFDVNGGTPAIAPITQDEGTDVTAPADPTRDGYVFQGWVPAVPATMPVDDVTCVAQWDALPTSTITFDVDGGTPAIAPITQAESTAVAAPVDPTRTSYIFQGWVPAVPATMPVDDVTCVAQWEATTNHAPAGADNTVTTLEDTPYAFVGEEFGFADPDDSPAHNFAAVKITTLPGAGTLSFGGSAVTNGQRVGLTDAGATWTARESNRLWSCVAASSDGTKLVAAVNGGQIYTSTDAGATWTARESIRDWYSVASSSDGTKLVAAVYGGQLYTSTDSGTNWTACESSRDWSCVAASSDGTKLVAAVNGGQIYTSTDSGTNWMALESSRDWSCVASSADGTKLVAADSFGTNSGGQIYTSTNSGTNWTARATNRTWQAVASSADGTKLVAVVANGQIYTSTNSGTNWTVRASYRGWQSVASSADGRRLVAAEYGGQIYTSTDSGATWTARGSNRTWQAVASSADGTKLVAAASNGQIYTSQGVHMTFTPGPDAYGSPYSSFTFQVQDDGGTAFGGVDLDPTPKTMTINVTGVPDDQTITFPAIGDKVTTDAVGLAATASSGLAVSFVVDSGPAMIAGLTNLTFTGTGLVCIVASQAGDGDWNPAPDATNTFNVTKAAATVYLLDLAPTYDGTARTVTATTMPAGLTVEITYAGSAIAPIAVGSYAVTGTVSDAMYQGSAAGTLTVGKAAATVALGSLSRTYDGAPKSATATTEPEGLTVEITYAGSATAPTAAGSYAVTGTVNEANWQGSATGTLTVGKAAATVALGSLSHTYDGTPKSATATTVPAGLTVEFTYAGSAIAPTAAGSYAVTGTVAEANWQGSATGTLTIAKAAAQVFLLNLAQTYDGTARTVTATTMPAGLTVEITYAGHVWAPTNAGTYAVTGTVAEANWQGLSTGTLTVAKADQTIDFPVIGDQLTIDAVGLAATASSGLAVSFAVGSGPATITDLTNLTFTGAGVVSIVALQAGDGNRNPAPDATNTFNVTKAAATVFLLDLAQTYAGTARTVTATTMPAGLTVEFTYDGSATAPIDAGTYAVTGTVADAMYQGSAADTLTVGKAAATVTLGSLSHTYDGTPKSATAMTEPEALTVEFTYDGSATAPTAAGSYAVTGTVAEANWQGSATGTLTIAKAAATVALGSLSPTYDGTPKSATATTEPEGLTVEFTYDGSATAPTAAGSYAVTGTVAEANYQGSATGTLTIAKAAAQVFLLNLAQTYDGTARTVTATTMPAGLTVEITYAGHVWAPTNAGTYAVTGTVAEANWQGLSTGTLTVAKADQAITFPAIGDQLATNRVGLAATASSGLGVSFAVGSGLATITDLTNLTFTGAGVVSIVASQAGDGNRNPAPDATNTFNVTKASATVYLLDLTQTYNGTARTATATTMPAGLTVEITYAGHVWAPTNAGTYTVTGTVADAMYQGSAAGTLTVGKADQTIENFLPADGEMFDLHETAAISATASSGLAVDFANLTPALATLAGADITFIKPGLARVEASQAGDGNWNPAMLVHGWRVMSSQNALCDFDGDGKADLAVYHAAAGNWYIKESSTGARRAVQWGWSSALPVPGDYDGDGITDVAVYHPASGNWFMACSTAGNRTEQWGWSNAVPVPGDYDGDGTTDVAVYDPIRLNWHLRMSAAGDLTVAWGLSNSVPAPADYDGDGVTDLAVYRPATGTWSIRYRHPAKGRPSEQTVQWGWSEAVPVPGDYDGDGAADIAVFHRASGNWYLLCSATGIRTEEWGWWATTPVAADYDGDGAADISVYHQAAGNWYQLESATGASAGAIPFGWSAAQPVLLQPLIHSWFGLP